MFKKKKKENVYKVKPTNEEKVEAYVTKEKKEITNPAKGIKFWAIVAGAAALIVLGVWIIADRNLGTTMAIGVTGAVVVIFGIARIIPLIRTQISGSAKLTVVIEIIMDILLGAFLFFAAVQLQRDPESGLGKFVDSYYRFFLGFVLYAKGVFYFIITSLLNEKTTKFEFWMHILIMTLGVVIFAIDFDASRLALVIAIICLLASLVLIAVSGSSYYNYRKSIHKPTEKTKNTQDEIAKEEEETILDIPQDDDRPVVQ